MSGITIQLLTQDAYAALGETGALRLANDAEAAEVDLDGVQVIELQFPKFTDGRAYSQAVVLRRRGFAGELRAVGDVLVDQVVQMQRLGFTSAVLRADQDLGHAQRQFSHFAGFYQGDRVERAPLFARAA